MSSKYEETNANKLTVSQEVVNLEKRFEKNLAWERQKINFLTLLTFVLIGYIFYQRFYIMIDLYEKIEAQAKHLYEKEKVFNSHIDNTVKLLSNLIDYLLRLKYPEGFVNIPEWSNKGPY
jgi:5-bromo-4-chloroindolyl phosphate hydrolysis protein